MNRLEVYCMDLPDLSHEEADKIISQNISHKRTAVQPHT